MSKFYELLTKIINRTKEFGYYTNLLDNSYFINPVNQDENTGFFEVTDNHPIRLLDRWYLTEGSANIEEGGIRLNGTMTQRVNTERSVHHYTNLVACAGFSDIEGDYLLDDIASYDRDTMVFTIATSESTFIEWVALYEGDIAPSHMPTYKPKEYPAELVACYRYRWRAKGYTTLYGYATNSTTAYLYINLPYEIKRNCIPLVKLTGATFTIRTTDGETHKEATITDTSPTVMGNIIRFSVSKEGLNLTSGNVVVATVSSSDGVLEVICE